jgi:exonuclease III
VDGISGHFPVFLQWFELAEPDIVWLQEMEAPRENFPEQAFAKAGY